MCDAYSRYVAFLDDIERIPVAASGASRLSAEETAVVIARVTKFVRDRVLPQSDLEEERLEALLQGGVVAVTGRQGTRQRRTNHEAIIQRIDALAHVDPHDRVRVQTLLYRLYETISSHFADAELIVFSPAEDEPSEVVPAAWFG